MSKAVKIPNDRGCLTDGCERPHSAQGYCHPCYKRNLRHGTIHLLENPHDPECTRKAWETRRGEVYPEGYKRCCGCHELKPLDAFYERNDLVNGPSPNSHCKPCQDALTTSWEQRYPDRKKEGDKRGALRRTYNISPEQWQEMYEQQNGCCASCGEPFQHNRDIHIDHDHSCCPGQRSCGQCIRGLLCRPCNWGIGQFSDDPARLRAAALYLEQHTKP